MFDRRRFLAGPLASPATAISGGTPTAATGQQRIWVIVGVNWAYNDEYNYSEGSFLTEYAFPDKQTAERKCQELIREFRQQEDPEQFVHGDLTLPDDWDEMTRDQQWDWLFAVSPTPDEHSAFACCEDGYGWVERPYEIQELRLPSSAAAQLDLARSHS
jgi:hypothetical protein